MDARQRFERIVDQDATGAAAGSEALAEGAMLISTTVDPSLDVDNELERLEDLASNCAGNTAEALAVELFGSGRFVGNTTDYYDAQNSMLSSVLDRGLGIPITLSVLFIDIGRRRGLAIDGVGMPGHFLTSSDGVFYDPFHAGVALDAEGCRRLYSRLAGRDVALPPRALEPTPPALILQRMLWNLRSIAEGSGDAAMRFRVLGMLNCFADVPLQVRLAWASSLAERGQYGQAADVVDRAIATAPEGAKDRLRSMSERWSARLN